MIQLSKNIDFSFDLVYLFHDVVDGLLLGIMSLALFDQFDPDFLDCDKLAIKIRYIYIGN